MLFRLPTRNSPASATELKLWKPSVTWRTFPLEELISNIIGVVDVIDELAVVPTENISDEVIAARILEELSDSGIVDPGQVLVEVEDGAVILSGMVKNYAVYNEVCNSARHMSGIRSITNNIAVAFTQDQ